MYREKVSETFIEFAELIIKLMEDNMSRVKDSSRVALIFDSQLEIVILEIDGIRIDYISY